MLLGPGDDAAMVSAPDGRVVVSTDLLIEGRHFRRDWSSGYDVGRKAAAQNLADIAAMGAVPTSIVVGLGMPADLPLAWLDALTDGFRDECAVVGASVAGGDITRCELVVIGVTALGDLGGRAPVTRSGARPGQVVAVAGRLGYAAAGLALLEAGVTGGRRRAGAGRGRAPAAPPAVRVRARGGAAGRGGDARRQRRPAAGPRARREGQRGADRAGPPGARGGGAGGGGGARSSEPIRWTGS